MGIQCPNCKSTHIHNRNIGKKAGGFIGTTAGASAGVTAAMSGARVGATVGVIAGPPGVALGTVAGAILGGVTGGIFGGTAGAALGEIVDNNILDNFECLKCGHRFSTDDEGTTPISLPHTSWQEDFDDRESALTHYKKFGERMRPTRIE